MPRNPLADTYWPRNTTQVGALETLECFSMPITQSSSCWWIACLVLDLKNSCLRVVLLGLGLANAVGRDSRDGPDNDRARGWTRVARPALALARVRPWVLTLSRTRPKQHGSRVVATRPAQAMPGKSRIRLVSSRNARLWMAPILVYYTASKYWLSGVSDWKSKVEFFSDRFEIFTWQSDLRLFLASATLVSLNIIGGLHRIRPGARLKL